MRKLEIAVLFLLAATATFAQTVTTTTNCDINGSGNSASVRCTSTDDAAQQKAIADQQAAQKKSNDELFAHMGNAVGNVILRARINKGVRKYCDQHQGEPWNWQVNGQNLSGTCPGEMSQAVARKQLIDSFTGGFKKDGVAGYAEIVGDRLTVHSERASAMRFNMVLHDPANQRLFELVKQAGMTTYVYTNDADVNLTYDVKSSQILTAPTESAAQTAQK